MWFWDAEVVVAPTDSRPVFAPGEHIATADWSTGGNDVDDIPDFGSFRMRASVAMVDDDYLTWYSGYDAKLFNPEPIPEPATFSLLLLAGLVLEQA